MHEVTSEEPDLLLLQYGSAYFEADETQESDFDILMVVKYREIRQFMHEAESRSHGFEITEARSLFFFGRFFEELSREP